MGLYINHGKQKSKYMGNKINRKGQQKIDKPPQTRNDKIDQAVAGKYGRKNTSVCQHH